jgi:DNA polymerase-3 subunit alpha (Gram-positive type)
MDENTVRLLDLFRAYEPAAEEKALLEDVKIFSAEVDMKRRTAVVTVCPDRYMPLRSVRKIEQGISRAYGMHQFALKTSYGPEGLGLFQMEDLGVFLREQFAPSLSILAGCSYALDGDTIRIQLRGNGKDLLKSHIPKAQQWLRGLFDRDIRIELVVGEDRDPKELFAATEKLRQAAMEMLPKNPEPVTVKKIPAAENPSLLYGKAVKGEPMPMKDITMDSGKVVVEGEVFAIEHRELTKTKAWIINFDMTDYTGSIRVNRYMDLKRDKPEPILNGISKGMWVKIFGKISFSRFENDLVLEPYSIEVGKKPQREDTAQEKRVELHLHTQMSSMDALTPTADVVALATKWGHRAIGITDHGVAQAFPDAMKAAKGKIKILYGCEGYFVNDLDDKIAVKGKTDGDFHQEYVVFDLETTGLSFTHDAITEIGAAIYKDGKMERQFQTFVDPKRKLPQKITELTGITDDMLRGAPDESEAIPAFLEFCGDRPLAAHNADFDVSFVKAAAQRLGLEFSPTYLDTLVMAQGLMPGLNKYKLNVVADALSLPDFNHHRAVDDAMTVGYMLERFFSMLEEQGIYKISEINEAMSRRKAGNKVTSLQARHIILYAKNNTGLRNLYRLISYGHLKYYKRVPRIPKSELITWREGLIVGSACEAGELFQAVVENRSWDELLRIASFYDFLEIQPICNNRFMIAKGTCESDEDLRNYNRTIVRLGEELNIPVVATGDVHFLNPEDEIFRHILLATKKYDDADKDLPIYFKSTDEMLEEFSYLGEEKCREVVVTNTNLIADMCDVIRPVPHNLFPPSIENSDQKLKDLVYGKMHELYGDDPPSLITERIETELSAILGRHYDVIYMSAQMLVANSLEHGYLVGSRGSVGSSLVAFMSGITEVNSLPAHYRCPNCKHTDFEAGEGYGCGADMPDAVCPICGAAYAKDGFDIPFETFLGFGGDKVPDIDLNFSGEYQAKAHQYCIEMFGSSHVFRAGTIGTVAEKTAYGYAMKYLQERNLTASKAEENRLAAGCTGVKRTTGQHPGGLVVIPGDKEIYDFCPVQHPADDPNTDIITTHFEYHCMEENLLKLDMLGHDDPTMIRMLEDMTGVDAKKIPLDDPETKEIFRSPAPLGLPDDDPIIGKTGSIGIPEFGTSFTRQMLVDTQPDGFDMLVRLSGFSHGTDVWLGNAKDLILSGTATVKETVGCRDDIMLFLISKGMDPKMAFKIMEAVRKGKVKKGGFQEGWVEKMQELGVPQWYIDSLAKIAYLFPKAHAVAYVMMAFRIAWFKVHEPLAFYSAYFYRKSQKGGFDAEMMTQGVDAVKNHIQRIKNDTESTDKDEDLLTTLEACYEFYLRGFEFAPIDIYRSHATKFNIADGKLLPPFVAVSGLGESAAWDILEGREGKTFISIEEFCEACPKVSKTHVELLRSLGAFGDLPETSQVSLF